jgi:hypothetical protein
MQKRIRLLPKVARVIVSRPLAHLPPRFRAWGGGGLLSCAASQFFVCRENHKPATVAKLLAGQNVAAFAKLLVREVRGTTRRLRWASSGRRGHHHHQHHD